VRFMSSTSTRSELRAPARRRCRTSHFGPPQHGHGLGNPLLICSSQRRRLGDRFQHHEPGGREGREMIGEVSSARVDELTATTAVGDGFDSVDEVISRPSQCLHLSCGRISVKSRSGGVLAVGWRVCKSRGMFPAA